MFLSVISIVLLVSVIILIAIMVILFFKNKKGDIPHIGTIAGYLIALAAAIFSIYSHGESLKQSEKLSRNALEQAENLSIIQTRPFIGIEQATLNVDDNQIRGDNKACMLTVFLKNYGHSPAKIISMDLDIVFSSKNIGMVKMSTHPYSKGASKIGLTTEGMIIGPGSASRNYVTKLWVNKEDTDLIKQGLVPIHFNITLSYSTLGLKKAWGYKIDGELFSGSNISIFKEELNEVVSQ